MQDYPDKKWRIARYEPNRQNLAKDGLLRIGIPSYLPIINQPYIAGNGAKCVRERPMFPGYLFVQFSLKMKGWGMLFQTPGIRNGCGNGLMRSASKEAYQELTDAQIAAIMFTERRIMGEKNVQAKARGLHIGDEVRVRVGRLADVLAKIETLDDDERIGVMYMLFGKEHREIVPLDRLAV